ncbi:MAG: MGMT family protein [Candidatus Stahlbacteria bacterium]|nr:MGMT family protein [Candidatus Stahlbacteria bacterium]
MKKQVSWREKLERKSPNYGKIVDASHNKGKRLGPGKLLIPNPLDIDTLIRKIPKGKLITVSQIREHLAKDTGANTSCPLVTGIFIRIVGETAEEDLSIGKKDITPYWRVIKEDGSLNPKFPGGVEHQASLLKKEGYKIELGKGKKPPRVKDFGNLLYKL